MYVSLPLRLECTMDEDREKYLSDLYYDTSGSGGLGGSRGCTEG